MKRVVTFLSVYAPPSGLSDEVKDLLFDQLHAVIARIPVSLGQVYDTYVLPCSTSQLL